MLKEGRQSGAQAGAPREECGRKREGRKLQKSVEEGIKRRKNERG